MLDFFLSIVYYCISTVKDGDKMSWDFSSDKPIFQQLVDIITLKIVSGEYAKGERMPSVRDLAVLAGVNPNTVQRALSAVEESGLIFTKRGDGRFVGEDDEIINSVKEKYVKENTDNFLSNLRALGLSDSEIKQAVNKNL